MAWLARFDLIRLFVRVANPCFSPSGTRRQIFAEPTFIGISRGVSWEPRSNRINAGHLVFLEKACSQVPRPFLEKPVNASRLNFFRKVAD